jgi:hypothetical protein
MVSPELHPSGICDRAYVESIVWKQVGPETKLTHSFGPFCTINRRTHTVHGKMDSELSTANGNDSTAQSAEIRLHIVRS